ncbi:heat shock factor protein 2 isoform X4 [Danaus plexippus]|uniref:heat shock factor protein 2 isoform X4 n=1 Tax=Danaus plexippus TaxID=13037 RepID=UPI002AB22164|nr:heat shock factor protein 2 isoform X4 [Danaus plexippus]
MRSVVEIGASVPAFLGKLWKLLNDTETNHLISWSPSGKTFVIKNQADFARELLPLYYKHNNMASFIRQLNMYGFHKITSVENGGLRYEKDEIEFSHPCFMRGHAYLLEHIKRKIANPKSIVASSESGEKILLKPEIMNKVLADVKQMKGKQESLDAKFSAMKQENEALWREVAILRQKHIKQQQIVNNLIQFLMSLVQPSRAPSSTGNNVGVKRPYQLMINNAAHNCGDSSYPGRLKNIKIDKDIALEDLSEENLEDGPTIHELVHDDTLHNEVSQDSLDDNFVSVDLANNPLIANSHNNSDPTTSSRYHVTMEDGEDLETDRSRLSLPIVNSNGLWKRETQPIVSPPSPTMASVSPVGQQSAENVNAHITISPGTSKTKARSNCRSILANKNVMSTSNFNSINPSADFKLPAEIFASDDSVSDVAATEEVLQDLVCDQVISAKDKMLGGVNIKIEKPLDCKSGKKSKKSKDTNDTCCLNLADIKTELQDDFDWNNMTLATVNNSNINRQQTVYRRDNCQNREDITSLFGSNSNKNDIDDHLDSMQTDLDSLKELLRGDTYALDTNTLLGIDESIRPTVSHHTKQNLFGSDDPFYGLSYNPSNDRAKTCSGAEGNQLISYTENIPDFEDINMPELEGENSQDCIPSPSSSTLNTPQVQLQSPSYTRP